VVAARRSMRHVDVFAWLTSERTRAQRELDKLRDKRHTCGHDYDAVACALDAARQSARIEQLDSLLAQLQS
jgi:hypothetical protein